MTSPHASPEGSVLLPHQVRQKLEGLQWSNPSSRLGQSSGLSSGTLPPGGSLCSREDSGHLHRDLSPLPLPWPQGSFLGFPRENLVGFLEVKPRTVWVSPDTAATRSLLTQGSLHSGPVIRQYHQSVPASSHPHLLRLQVSRPWCDPLHPLFLQILRWWFACILISLCLQAKLILVCLAFPGFMDGSESQTL